MKTLFALLMSMLMLLSCSKEPEKSPEPVSAEKSIFEEVKEQTIRNPKDADAWYHLAVTVNDGRMETYVNGIRELAGSIPFSPFKGGQVSVGVRQNKVYWFKGAICRIRVTPRVLNRSEFMRLQDSQIPEPE